MRADEPAMLRCAGTRVPSQGNAMSKRFATPYALVIAVAALGAFAPRAQAQVEPGNWTPYSPTFVVQERGCGQVSNLTFTLTCTDNVEEHRAERRYATYTTGTSQFEGYVKLVSLGGTRVNIKQTFSETQPGPIFGLAVERGGRVYVVGGTTVGSGFVVGSTMRVNTINEIGKTHRLYLNGSLVHTRDSAVGRYYDKLGTYRTRSGNGPITVTWSNLRFWKR